MDNRPVHGKDEICRQIAESLGIKNCRKLTLNINYNQPVSATAEFLVENKSLQEIKLLLADYWLCEKSHNEEDVPNENRFDTGKL